MAKFKGQERSPKSKPRTINHSNSNKLSIFKMPVLNTILTIICLSIAVWFGYKGYLETRVNTPYDVEKVRFYLLIISLF